MTKENTIIGIASKPSHELAEKLGTELLQWILDNAYDYRVDTATSKSIKSIKIDESKIVHRKDITQHANPVVVLGGDGTLISVSRYPTSAPPIIIGVNLGTLGFLTEITVDELFPTLEAVLKDKASIKRRPLLRAEVTREEQIIETFYSINDIVVTKEALARIFDVGVYINQDYATSIRGDGVIIATPGGSTAYSLSAGGSIVYPTVDATLITPICSHSLTSRPFVIPGSATVTLKINYDGKTERDKVYLTIDGQEGMPLIAEDEVAVTTSSHEAFFAKSPSKNFFEVLATKLKWDTSNVS